MTHSPEVAQLLTLTDAEFEAVALERADTLDAYSKWVSEGVPHTLFGTTLRKRVKDAETAADLRIAALEAQVAALKEFRDRAA